MPQMIKKKKDTTDRAEREQLYCAYTKPPLEPHFPFLGKGFVLTENVNVRFLQEWQRLWKIKDTEQALCFFLDAELFQTMMA